MTTPIQNKPNTQVGTDVQSYKGPTTPPAETKPAVAPQGWKPSVSGPGASSPLNGVTSFDSRPTGPLGQGSPPSFGDAKPINFSVNGQGQLVATPASGFHLDSKTNQWLDPSGKPTQLQSDLQSLAGKASGPIDPQLFKSLITPGLESKLPDQINQGLGALSRLNLSPQDIAGAGRAIPDLVQAGLSYAKGDQKGAALHLLDAAYKDPQLAEKIAPVAAQLIPSSNDTGTRLAQELLSDPAAVKDLVTHQNLRGAFDKLLSKPADVEGALTILSKDPQTVGDLANVLSKDPRFGPLLKQYGLAPQNLKDGAAALPDLYRAYQDQQKGDTRDAFGALLDAGKKSPQLAESILTAYGKNMKAGDKGYNAYEKAILSDPKCVHDLVTDPKAGDAAEKLIGGDTTGAALELAQDPTAAQHFAAALAGQPGVDNQAWSPVFKSVATGVNWGEQATSAVTNGAKQVFSWMGF